ncbi:MAG: PAS domain S-box protein, partial [Candidatus Aureabacteria bacterium]|nr:PAS domain S-box protein [Candidatus Auribacterota bacterium]
MNASLKTDKADLTQIRRLENELRQLRKKEKKHALVEKTLAISQASINELANLLPNSVFELDMKGNVVFANTAGLNVFGLTQKDLKKGFTAFDVIAPESHEDVRKNMQKVLKGGQEHMPHQYLGLKKDGTKFPVLLQSSSVIKNGKAVGIRGVILDITKMQEAHDLISKAKSELEHTVEMRDIELKISVEKLHRILEQIISAFASTIEKRDPYTAGHQQRTATLAQAIAHKMGLSVETIKTIYMASLIHDIGKIYVPAEI